MTSYRFTAMDLSGREITDAIEAEDADDAIRKLRARGLYPVKMTGVTAEGLDAPPEPALAPGKPVEGRACPRGKIRCQVEKDGVEVAGSFNMLGEGGKVYIVVDADGMEAPSLKISMQDVAGFRRSGLLWRRLTVEMTSGVKYVFKGDVGEVEKHLRFGMFVSHRQA